MLKAVLFDIDDTLIDWSDFRDDWETLSDRHLRGVFDYIRQHHPLDDLEAFATEFHNRTMAAWVDARASLRAPHVGAVLVESALALGVPDGTLDMRRCLEAYCWGVIEGTRVFPDAVDALRLLRRHGIRLGVVTNAYQPMALRDTELKALGLAEFFPDCRFSAADFGYLKPHPSIFRAALDCIGALPEETVFVGDDLEADIGGAQGAGVFAVWRRVSRRMTPPPNGIAPDATLHSLTELPAILDTAFPGWRA